MERFYKRKIINKQSSNIGEVDSDSGRDCSKKSREEICLDDLPADPGLRKNIVDYDPSYHDEIRIAYLLKGPCQPREHNFPKRKFGNIWRRFVPDWFDEFKTWLEYSIEKDAAFCLYCYLYRSETVRPASDAFVEGFSNWKKKERFRHHVGNVNSAHNLARDKCQNLLNQNQYVDVAFFKHSEQTWLEYKTCLLALIDCARFLLHQGLAFRGHDDPSNSDNKGNFLELLHFLADHNEDIRKIILENALGNLKFTSLDIQKDIIHALAVETTSTIIDDVGSGFFSLLVYESCDVSKKEHFSIVLRYVDSRGCVIERFLGIIHASDASASTLKMAIDAFFSKHGLNISCVRGQSYDGACNTQGECNGLKDLILNENSSAHHVHCFAHHLLLSLVTVAKKHVQVYSMYDTLLNLINVVEASFKCKEFIGEDRLQKVVDDLLNGALVVGQDLNQETILQRASDAWWGSHFSSLLRLILMFDSVIDVLQIIETNGALEQRGQAYIVLNSLQSFEFAFLLHLVKKIMGIANTLCETLQRKDQDIVNAMALVKITKKQFLATRDEGWDSLLDEVHSFCKKHEIFIPNMNEKFVALRRSRKNGEETTNLHHYQVELFCSMIDMQVQELNSRFNEVNSELLLCMACLNPDDSFSAYDKQKLIRLAKFYPKEFCEVELLQLNSELDMYIADMRYDSRFFELNSISDLAEKMVETKKDAIFPLVNILLKLCLILPVAAPVVERAFSATIIVKDKLRNQMGDSWMNDCLITYIEKDLSEKVQNEKVIEQYQNMRKHRE